MTRKLPRNGRSSSGLPVSDYWEERTRSWEGDLGEDRLGADHEGRFDTVALVTSGKPPKVRLLVGDVSREAIGNLVGPLELDDPEPLIDQLWAIAGRHLRPAHRKLLGSDPASTQKLLGQISEAAEALNRQLDDIAPVTLSFLEEFYGSIPENERRLPTLNLDMFGRSLTDLAMLCAMASNELINVRNRPVLALRQQTLKSAVAAIEEHTGREVKTRWSHKDRKLFEFQGTEGEAVRAFMGLIEPIASERSLVQSVRSFAAKKQKGWGAAEVDNACR